MTGKINSKDLVALHKAFKLFQVQLPDAGDDVLKDTAKMIARESASKVQSRPGSRGSYKREPGAYDAKMRNQAPSVEIQRGGTAIAAEYGANFHVVFGNRVAAKSMKRRVFGGRVKRWRSGKVVGKLVKTDLPDAEKRLAKAFDQTAEKTFTRLGL